MGVIGVTFAGELDSIDKMLIQTELTVIAGDHESYSISAHKRSSNFLTYINHAKINCSPIRPQSQKNHKNNNERAKKYIYIVEKEFLSRKQRIQMFKEKGEG